MNLEDIFPWGLILGLLRRGSPVVTPNGRRGVVVSVWAQGQPLVVAIQDPGGCAELVSFTLDETPPLLDVSDPTGRMHVELWFRLEVMRVMEPDALLELRGHLDWLDHLVLRVAGGGTDCITDAGIERLCRLVANYGAQVGVVGGEIYIEPFTTTVEGT